MNGFFASPSRRIAPSPRSLNMSVFRERTKAGPVRSSLMKRTPETTESDHSVRTPEASNCGAGGLPARSELVLPASRDKLPNELPAISPTLIEAFFGGVKERFLLRQQAQTVHTRLELFESLLRQQNRISELQ